MVFIRFKAIPLGWEARRFFLFDDWEIIANFAAWRELARRVKFAAPPRDGWGGFYFARAKGLRDRRLRGGEKIRRSAGACFVGNIC